MYRIGKEEIEAVRKVIESKQLFKVNNGDLQETMNAEKELCEKLGAKHALVMTSGHAAIASAIVMIVWLLTKNIIIFLLTTILMLLVIHSRVEAKIHSVQESVLGVILGFSISLVIVGLCKYFGII